MNCPYCGNEMADGYLGTGPGRIAWLTEEPGVHAYPQGEDEFFLTKPSFWKCSSVKAPYCKGCKIIIINALFEDSQAPATFMVKLQGPVTYLQSKSSLKKNGRLTGRPL